MLSKFTVIIDTLIVFIRDIKLMKITIISLSQPDHKGPKINEVRDIVYQNNYISNYAYRVLITGL